MQFSMFMLAKNGANILEKLEIGYFKRTSSWLVFLPYMQDRQGVTYCERMEQRGFLLDSGTSQQEEP